MLAARPGLRTEIGPEHHAILREAAERGDAAALGAMLACGFDANVPDEMGVTALHRAAMGGQVEAVRVLLAHGASMTALDQEFNAPPLLWTAEGARMRGSAGGTQAEVAKLLLAAGSPTEWRPKGEPSEAILEIMAEWRRS
jgi:ankyrin repeat protein